MRFLIEMHSGWRWIVLLSALAAIVVGFRGRREGAEPNWAGRVFPIAADIQVLVGLILWSGEELWTGAHPFFSFVHPVLMLGAVALAHVGSRRESKSVAAGLGTGAGPVFYIASLVVMAIAIPWARV